MGDAGGAAARLGEAQAELLRSVGPGDVLSSWVAVAAQIRALCECEVGGAEEAAVVRGTLEAAAKKKMESCWSDQEDRGYWYLLRAGAAAAARAPDGEVLGLLEEAASYGCWVPAGSRPVDEYGKTEGRLPEWEEFLGRMAMTAAADGDKEMEDVEDAGAGKAGRRWWAYRGTTDELARERVAMMDGDYIEIGVARPAT
jgi:hypothetical protein